MNKHSVVLQQWESFLTSKAKVLTYDVLSYVWLLCHTYFFIRVTTIIGYEWNLPLVEYPYPLLHNISSTPKIVILTALVMHAACTTLLIARWNMHIVRFAIAILSMWILCSSASFYSNHLAFYCIATIYIAFIEKRKPIMSALPLRLLQLHLSMLYFFSALHKSVSGWADRWSYTMEPLEFISHPFLYNIWENIAATPIAYALVHTYILLLFLCALGALFVHKRWQFAVLGMGIHALMLIHVQDVTVFGFALMTSAIWIAAALESPGAQQGIKQLASIRINR